MAAGNIYTGPLYAGLMKSPDGQLEVIEFNCCFGDPKTKPIILHMRSDLAAHCFGVTEGRFDKETSKWDKRPALGVVVLVAGGYPGDYRTMNAISGLSTAITVAEGEKSFMSVLTCIIVREY